MKNRVLSVLSILLVADVYFYQAVKALTTNPLILVSYWLIDLLLVAGMVFVMVIRKPNQSPPRLISAIMALLLISMVPKLCAVPVLLFEDIIRIFRVFRPEVNG